MKYIRKTAEYAWSDCKKRLAKELNITPVSDKLKDYRRTWI